MRYIRNAVRDHVSRHPRLGAKWAERADAGISLVEVVIAFVVLLIVTLPASYFIISGARAAALSREDQTALQLADRWVEILSNQVPPQNSTTGQPEAATSIAPKDLAGQYHFNDTVGGIVYTLSSYYSLSKTNGQNSSSQNYCSNNTSPPGIDDPAVFILKVTVTWGHNGANTLTESQAIDYPQPGIQNFGYLAVSITANTGSDPNGNSMAKRLENVPVVVTNTGTNTSTTSYPDQNGCVLLEVAPGSYDVTVSNPSSTSLGNWNGSPSFVDSAFPAATSVSTSSPVTVAVDAEQLVSFSFDEGVVADLSYNSATTVTDGVSCFTGSTPACVAVGTSGIGSGATSAAFSYGSGSSWTASTGSALSRVDAFTCTTRSTCVAMGVGGATSSPVIAVESSGLGSATSETVPTTPDQIASFQSVVCPSGRGCYAIANTTTGTQVLLAGAVGTGSDTWVELTPPNITVNNLAGLSCPSGNECELGVAYTDPTSGTSSVSIVDLSGDPDNLAGNPSWQPTVSFPAAIPPTLGGVNQVDCFSATQCTALVSDGGVPEILKGTISAASLGGNTVSWVPDTLPTVPGTLSQVSCASSACVAIGTSTSGAAIAYTGAVGSSLDVWQSASLPTVSALNSVSCGKAQSGDALDCAIAASTSTGGELLDGALSSATGAWTWNSITMAGVTPTYLTQVSCQLPTAGGNCAAVGADANAAGLILETTSGPGGGWSVANPQISGGGTVSGAYVDGIPLQVLTNGNDPTVPSSWNNSYFPYIPPGNGAPATSFSQSLTSPGPLYPAQLGYSVAAGDCDVEANTFPVGSLAGQPGSTETAAVPLGIAKVDVLNANGSPANGATVSLTATSVVPSDIQKQVNGYNCNADQYALPNSAGDGIAQSAVPFGSYDVTVTLGASTVTASLSVTADGIANATVVLP